MKKILILIISLAFFCSNLSVFASVYGGSNLDFMGYQEHDCSKPVKPYSFYTEYEIDTYKNNVNEYISCIKNYVENANNDIERIKIKINNAIYEVNNY